MRFHPHVLLLLVGSFPAVPIFASKGKTKSPGKGTKSPGKGKKSRGKGKKCSGKGKKGKREPAELNLLTGLFGGETAFVLNDGAFNTLSEVEFGTLDTNTQYNFDFGCLDTEDCYTFTVFDSFGDGMNGGTYNVTFGEDTFESPSNGDFGSQESIQFGDACSRRLMAIQSFTHYTSVEDDDRTVHLKISVETAQDIHVVITDWEDEAEIVAELWNGPVEPGQPVELIFDAGNIHVPTYKANITSDTGSSKSFTLAKVSE